MTDLEVKISTNFDFEDSPVIKPRRFTYNDKEFEVREASCEAAENYRNSQLASITLGPNSKPQKIIGIASSESGLVNDCVFQITKDDQGNEVFSRLAKGYVKTWKNSVVKELLEWIKDVSNLNETDPGIVEGLKQACELPGSPVKYEVLKTFVQDLPEEEYKSLQELFELTSEERAKN